MSKSAMMLVTPEVVSQIAKEQNLEERVVEATLKLLLDDCTVPFIARYRKEATGAMNEVQIREVRDQFEYIVTLHERRDVVLRSIEEQGKLSDELRQKILACTSRAELEDIYLPFKPRKRTRGQIARERGLEPLADAIIAQDGSLSDPAVAAQQYVGAHPEVTSLEIALQGAKDILAEQISEIAEVRGELRQWMLDSGSFRSAVREAFADKKTKFNDYYDFVEPVGKIAPHRLMALRRGEKENILRVTLECETDAAIDMVRRRVVSPDAVPAVAQFLQDCVADAFNRLLAPSIETEIRLETRSRAEEEAIRVFAKNLRNLLLLPPIPKRLVVGIDPGIRTGSKIVVVSSTGQLIEYSTIFPDTSLPADAPKNATAVSKIVEIVKKYEAEYVAIGNGTGGRELHALVEAVLEKAGLTAIRAIIVNEAGASVYSASDVAREEFPDLDITYRGAVSIARRLQDPLAELVKIDPKSIGVGQYQHDVNQSRLKKSLEEVVESCVNHVGVNLNTASPSLLSYVSGIGPSLARHIVDHRNRKGEFSGRQDLLEVQGFGPKTFEQAAGFLRVPESTNPLDNSAVHPERYPLVERFAQDLGVEVRQLVGNKEAIEKLNAKAYVCDEVGLPTIEDILKELLKPGRDPRAEGVKHTYNRNVRSFEDLQEGQIVLGTVTNVTNFGAFVDIGVHQDGLIHISELSNRFIRNPIEAIAVGEIVKVKVIAVDRERRRINLSRRALEAAAPGATAKEPEKPRAPRQEAASAKKPEGGGKSRNQQASQPRPRNRDAEKSEARKPTTNATLDDLMSKFNGGRM